MQFVEDDHLDTSEELPNNALSGLTNENPKQQTPRHQTDTSARLRSLFNRHFWASLLLRLFFFCNERSSERSISDFYSITRAPKSVFTLTSNPTSIIKFPAAQRKSGVSRGTRSNFFQYSCNYDDLKLCRPDDVKWGRGGGKTKYHTKSERRTD